LFTAFFPGFFSIPLAFYGFGVWALVAGALAGQILNLSLLWRYSPWRPRLQYDLPLARGMLKFGLWVVGESFGAWLIMWGDNLIVGRFLGVHDLGVYRTGWMLVTVIFGLVLNPFLPVLYPTFSRLQNDLSALKENFHKVNRVVMALALPMGIGLLLVGPELASVLFGSKWQGLGLVLSVVGLTLGLAWSVGINTELYRAMGRPDINTKLMLVTILLYMPAYYIAAQFNLEIFLYVRLSLVFVGIAIQVYLCRRMLSVSPFYLLQQGKNFILAAIAMGLGVGITKWGIHFIDPAMPEVLTLAFLIVMGAGIYMATLWIMDRAFILQTSRLIRRAALT
jgi:O-antigen/teichoic acid export membrane protein